MLEDLKCNIVQGGFRAYQITGVYPNYFTFSSKSIGLRTGKRRLHKGITKGFVSKNKTKLFYFEIYEGGDGICKVFPIINNIQSAEPIYPDGIITILD